MPRDANLTSLSRFLMFFIFLPPELKILVFLKTNGNKIQKFWIHHKTAIPICCKATHHQQAYKRFKQYLYFRWGKSKNGKRGDIT